MACINQITAEQDIAENQLTDTAAAAHGNVIPEMKADEVARGPDYGQVSSILLLFSSQKKYFHQDREVSVIFHFPYFS